MIASATSESLVMDQVTESFRSLSVSFVRSFTDARYVFACSMASLLSRAVKPSSPVGERCFTTWIKCNAPGAGEASAVTRFAAGMSAASARGEPSNGTRARRGEVHQDPGRSTKALLHRAPVLESNSD